MKKTLMYFMAGTILLATSSCGNNESKEAETEETKTEEVQDEQEEEEVSMHGTYHMTDMIPDAGDKKLTATDEKYIKESKERTVGKTTLTLNEDGTFVREFPHPSGDGTMSKWTGTYEMDEEKGTCVLNAEMNGKTMKMDFTIVENTGDKLSLRTVFGQIFMVYVYTKK